MKQHPFAEQLRALADGQDLEWKIDIDADWDDEFCDAARQALLIGDESFQFRIKKQKKKGWYRVALCARYGELSTLSADDDSQEALFSRSKEFIRWLTDRIEYEYE